MSNVCYLPITSLRLSTLDCFLQSNLIKSNATSKTTLNEIIDNLMLENWTFEKCSYSMMIAKDPLSIFTNLLGLCKLYLVNKCSIYFRVLKYRWWFHYFLKISGTCHYSIRSVCSKYMPNQSTNCIRSTLKKH